MDKKGTVILADAIHDSLVSEKDGTSRDVHDMHRMGKKQLLRRNFRFFSIFSFTVVLLSTWEVVLGTAAFGLGNGGTAGLIYMYILTFSGYIFVIASMAEMAPMAPTAGGQYHWISEFAPPSAQKFLSYTMGWLSVLAWQCGTAAGCFLAATELQGILVLNYPGYIFQNWHGTLISILIVILLVVLNTIGIRLLPWLETCAFVLHMAGFFAFIIPVWFMGPKPSPSMDVFTQFTNQGGWHSSGLSVLIGIITPVTALIGSDSAVHLSEELRNASKSLPRAMMATIVLNGGLGFVTVLTFCYNIGDVSSLLDTPTGFPFIQLYYNMTGSIKGTSALVSVMIILSIANATANMATASRQLFAFARDNGVPFRQVFAHVPARGPIREIPFNAILFTGVVSSLLSVINVGSTIAYNQLASMGIAALLSSYLVSTSCMALRRIRRQPLLPAHFTLGRAGLPVNLVAIGFLLLAFTMSFFPPVADPAPDTMNWAILVYGVVIAASLAYYIPMGRHHYKGPVVYVRQDY
ncbi:amino acid transporter [Apiospora rasikravindrae]|uniref:Amino acid transporter n=1 Tax=Apiospora rasikravindrae TaxID=990691 RepID=A0ABR1SXC1_9PEZI